MRCVFGVLGHLAPVHRCARSVPCVACVVSSASWLLFTGVPAWCVALSSVSWATWVLFTGVLPRCVALCVRCPGPLGCCSPLCPLGATCCMCGLRGLLAPVYRCPRLVRCVVCSEYWAPWLLFSGLDTQCLLSRLWCPEASCSCSPACTLNALRCLCCVLGHLAPVDWCARSVCCVACAVFWATGLLFTNVFAQCGVSPVECPETLGSSSPVRAHGVFCWLHVGCPGPLAPVHWCAGSVRSVFCATSWITWLLFTVVPARCVVFLCGVLRHLAPAHQYTRWVSCGACAGRPCGLRTCSSEQRLVVAGRCWVPSSRAYFQPDGGCFVAGRGWVRCRAHTRPSGRRLFRSRQGCYGFEQQQRSERARCNPTAVCEYI